jgi:hypothetical protein
MISLALQSAMNVTINNLYTNIELASPVYLTKDATCQIQFPQKVNSKSEMQTNFKTGIDEDKFGGILLYHLQKEESNEPDKDISTQLLVIWGRKSGLLYSRAWLIEYESKFTWNKIKLERLYYGYDRRYNTHPIPSGEMWLLNDNTMLRTLCRISYERGFEMKITISEEELPLRPIRPLWIDSDR